MARLDEPRVQADSRSQRSRVTSWRRSARGPTGPADRETAGVSPLSLRQNFAWTLPANVFYAACQWGILVILAKLGTAAMVGTFVLGLSVTAPVFVCASLQLRSIQATDAKREYRFGEYLGLRLLASNAALLIVLVAALVTSSGGSLLAAVLLIALAKAIESVSDIVYGCLQQYERMDRVARSKIAQGVLALVGISIGLSLTDSIVGAAAGLVASRLIVLITYDLPNAVWIVPRRGGGGIAPSGNLRRLGRLAWVGLPLAGTTLLISLETYIPHYFVAHYYGVPALGIFGAIAALITAGGTVTRAINQVCSPRLAEQFHRGERAGFRRLLGRILGGYIVLGLLGIAIVMVAGRPMLSILFRPEYAAYTRLLLLVMTAAAVAYLSGAITTAMIAVRLIGCQLPLRCLTMLVALSACWFLVPGMGIEGAAVALIVAKIPFVAIGLVLLWRATQPIEQSPVIVVETGGRLVEGG